MMRGSGLQWSFTDTASASPQILSFKSAQERGGSHKPCPPIVSQRNLPITISHHRWQSNDTQSDSHAQEVRMFPTANHTNQVVPATKCSVLQSHLALNGTSLVGSHMGGASDVSSVSISPPNCPIVGSTDLRNSSSISTGPCQLTIFYNGSVCVYDNVTPEKAQAIMLLAGNGESTSSSGAAATVLSSAPKQQPTVLKPPAANDTTFPNYQSVGFPSSMSLHQPVSSLSVVASSCVREVTLTKPVMTPPSVKRPEPRKSGASVEAGTINFIPSAVPQARKASLARFLEKRKERVIGVAPYIVSKNSSECTTIGPNGSTFATNYVISSPLPTRN